MESSPRTLFRLLKTNVCTIRRRLNNKTTGHIKTSFGILDPVKHFPRGTFVPFGCKGEKVDEPSKSIHARRKVGKLTKIVPRISRYLSVVPEDLNLTKGFSCRGPALVGLCRETACVFPSRGCASYTIWMDNQRRMMIHCRYSRDGAPPRKDVRDRLWSVVISIHAAWRRASAWEIVMRTAPLFSPPPIFFLRPAVMSCQKIPKGGRFYV